MFPHPEELLAEAFRPAAVMETHDLPAL